MLEKNTGGSQPSLVKRGWLRLAICVVAWMVRGGLCVLLALLVVSLWYSSVGTIVNISLLSKDQSYMLRCSNISEGIYLIDGHVAPQYRPKANTSHLMIDMNVMRVNNQTFHFHLIGGTGTKAYVQLIASKSAGSRGVIVMSYSFLFSITLLMLSTTFIPFIVRKIKNRRALSQGFVPIIRAQITAQIRGRLR